MNDILAELRSLRPVANANGTVDKTALGSITRSSGGGGSGSLPVWFLGEYVSGMSIKTTQAVVVTGVATGGISQGLYVALVDNPTTHPSDGAPNWMQIASSNFFGNWA